MPADHRSEASPPWLSGASIEADREADDTAVGLWFTGGASLLAWTGFVLLLTAS